MGSGSPVWWLSNDNGAPVLPPKEWVLEVHTIAEPTSVRQVTQVREASFIRVIHQHILTDFLKEASSAVLLKLLDCYAPLLELGLEDRFPDEILQLILKFGMGNPETAEWM